MQKCLYRGNLMLEQSRAEIGRLAATHPESADDVQTMLAFLDQVSPQRGIVR